MNSGVIAYSANDGLHLFRSYETLSDEADDRVQEKPYACQIWEAARATTAAPTYFPPATINGSEFMDGGLGANNPTLLSLTEVLSREPNSNLCIVSIGSGNLHSERMHFNSSISSVIKSLRQAATDTEEAHRAVFRLAANSQNISYFRFNVAQYPRDFALDDWAAIDDITVHTDSYLSNSEVRESLRRCALTIVESHRLASPRTPPEESKLLKFVNVPARNHAFFGQEQILKQMSNHLLSKHLYKRQSCVLYGMEGTGKTQIALEYIYRQKKAYSSIFWINAETKIQLSEGFYSIASAVWIGTKDHVMAELVREWLSITG
jgi:hypothetical protein